MKNEIKALIFDFGGVISRTLFETHDMSERQLGLPAGTFSWLGPFNPKGDKLWMKMQFGEITERDYWKIRTQEVSKLLGKDWKEMSEFVKAVRSENPIEAIRPQFLKIFHLANKTKIPLAILSNELDLFYGADFRSKLPFLKEFKVIHDATYTKVLKPNPKSYIDCIDALCLKSQDCLFIDDQLRNIKGAERVGLNTIHFDVTKPDESYNRVAVSVGLINGKV